MWFFKTKEQKLKAREEEQNAADELALRQLAFFSKYPVGHSFEYLGVKMMVVKHNPEINVNPYYGRYGYYRPCTLGCEYVDSRGILRSAEVRPDVLNWGADA